MAQKKHGLAAKEKVKMCGLSAIGGTQAEKDMEMDIQVIQVGLAAKAIGAITAERASTCQPKILRVATAATITARAHALLAVPTGAILEILAACVLAGGKKMKSLDPSLGILGMSPTVDHLRRSGDH